MKKIFLIQVVLSIVLSSCWFSYRRVKTFLTAKDPQEIFVRIPVEIVADYRIAQMRDRSGYTVTSPLRRAPDGIYIADTLASQIRRIGWNNDFIVIEEQQKT